MECGAEHGGLPTGEFNTLPADKLPDLSPVVKAMGSPQGQSEIAGNWGRQLGGRRGKEVGRRQAWLLKLCFAPAVLIKHQGMIVQLLRQIAPKNACTEIKLIDSIKFPILPHTQKTPPKNNCHLPLPLPAASALNAHRGPPWAEVCVRLHPSLPVTTCIPPTPRAILRPAHSSPSPPDLLLLPQTNTPPQQNHSPRPLICGPNG